MTERLFAIRIAIISIFSLLLFSPLLKAESDVTNPLCEDPSGKVAFENASHPEFLLHCGDILMQKKDYPGARHYFEQFLMAYKTKDDLRVQAKHKWFLCMDKYREILKERQHIPTRIDFTKPKNISGVPADVIEEFERRQCAVAQGYLFNGQRDYSPKIFSGQFAKRGQHDWVTVCGKGSSETEISIVWGGSARCGSTIAPTDIGMMMTQASSGQPYFAHTVGSVDPQALASAIKKYPLEAGLSPDLIDHEAVLDSDNSMVGRQEVWYCDAGKWKTLRLDEGARVEVFDREHN